MTLSTIWHRLRLKAAWPILLPALALVLLFPYLPALRSPNELCRLRQTQALVESGRFEITDALRTHGWVGDLSCVAIRRDEHGDVAERRACPSVRGDARFGERHYYPSKAPLLSVAAVPIYAALRAMRDPVPETLLVFFARLFCTILPSVLILIPLRRFLRERLRAATSPTSPSPSPSPSPSLSTASISPTTAQQAPSDRLADALTAAFALGTLAFSYAALFMSHALTGVLGLATFLALCRATRSDAPDRWHLCAGLFAGLTVASEYTGALALVPLALYALATAPKGPWPKLRTCLFGILGVLPSALLLALYHWKAFGHPLTTGYLFLNDAAYQGWHVGGFLGVRLPDARAFALSFFSPLRGLFTLSPFLLLALPGLALGLATKARRAALGPELWLSLALLLAYAYFTSSFTYDSWGWTTGPRHLTPLVPFLLLPIGVTLWTWRERPWLTGICVGLVALSMLSTGVMTLLNYIPDSLTNALHQVAWPLLFEGYLPHSPLSLLGVPNPWAALPGLLAICLALGLTAWSLLPSAPKARARSLNVALVVLLALTIVQATIRPSQPRAFERDEKTLRFLKERYAPRPFAASVIE
ncbi:MAG: hypothetical protein LBM75_03535 [Myxococcales bacterium]|jgi:hypothetical protein|nr:hypothetical protein [Myxococcales bacterium]